MNMQDMANYFIIIYGIAIPIYYGVRNITVKMLLDRKEREQRESMYNIPIIKSKRYERMPQQTEQDSIRKIIYDDNKTTNLRITELKKIIR